MTDVQVGFPVVYRAHSGDIAAIVTAVHPSVTSPVDPNNPTGATITTVETVDLVLFPAGAFLPQQRPAVEYDGGRNAYHTWRNIGEEWDDTIPGSPSPGAEPAPAKQELTTGAAAPVNPAAPAAPVAVPGVQPITGGSA